MVCLGQFITKPTTALSRLVYHRIARRADTFEIMPRGLLLYAFMGGKLAMASELFNGRNFETGIPKAVIRSWKL